MVEVFKDAMEIQKEQEQNRDFLEDYLLDQREAQEANKEVGYLLNELAQGDIDE